MTTPIINIVLIITIIIAKQLISRIHLPLPPSNAYGQPQTKFSCQVRRISVGRNSRISYLRDQAIRNPPQPEPPKTAITSLFHTATFSLKKTEVFWQLWRKRTRRNTEISLQKAACVPLECAWRAAQLDPDRRESFSPLWKCQDVVAHLNTLAPPPPINIAFG